MPRNNGSHSTTHETLAIVTGLREQIDRLEVAITYDLDLPNIEREVDGGIRWKLRQHASTVRIATERLHRELTEALAELERVQGERDTQPFPVQPQPPPLSQQLRAEPGVDCHEHTPLSADVALHGLRSGQEVR